MGARTATSRSLGAGQGGRWRAGHRRLNASTGGGWVHQAQRIEAAGADALELNLYHLATDPRRTAAEMEAIDLGLIADVRDASPSR